LETVGQDPYREPALRPKLVEVEIPSSSIRWFVQRRRGVRGPYTTEQMGRKLRKRLVTAATLVRTDTSRWRPVRTFALLAPYETHPTAHRAAPATSAEVRSGALATWWMRQDELVRAALVLVAMAVLSIVIANAMMAIAWPNGPPAGHRHGW
jgi:hypothetical protein